MKSMNELIPPLIAAVATLSVGLFAANKAHGWGFIDIPDARKVHSDPTPRTGGLAMIGGVVIAYLIARYFQWLPAPGLPITTLLSGTGFIALGGLDDYFTFHPRHKFLMMAGLALLAAWPWSRHALDLHLGQRVMLIPSVVVFATLAFWFSAVPNAVNIQDAINGYMGGYTLIVLGVLKFEGVDTRLFVGALIGFLLINWPKARCFMGDTGSYGCGFLIAECCLRADAAHRPLMAIALTAPISMDVAMGLLRRKSLGQGFFVADNQTFPHHILRRAGSVAVASPLLWALALAFAFARSHPLALGVLAITYAMLLIWLNRHHLSKRESLNG